MTLSTATIALLEWLWIFGGLWLAYLRWKYGPFKNHALWLYRWNRRRLMARMRRDARNRRRWHRHDHMLDNVPPYADDTPMWQCTTAADFTGDWHHDSSTRAA